MKSFLLILFFLPLFAGAQTASQKRLIFNEPSPLYQNINDALLCADGGWMFIGEHGDSTGQEYWNYLVKTDGSYNVQWTHSSQYAVNLPDDFYQFTQLDQMPDGNILVSGYSYPYPFYSFEHFFMSISPGGSVNWTTRFGNGSSYVLYFNPGYSFTASSILISGNAVDNAGNNAFLGMSLDYNGNVNWAKTYGSGDIKNPSYSSCAANDGGMLISGKATNDIYLVRTDAAGNLLWSKRFYDGNYSRAFASLALGDGNFLIGGLCSSSQSGLFIMKLDPAGNVIWRRDYAGQNQVLSIMQFVQLNNGHILCVSEPSYQQHYMRIDGNGNMLDKFMLEAPDANLSSYGSTRIRNTPDDNPYLLQAGINYNDFSSQCFLMRSDWLAFSWCGKGTSVITEVPGAWNPTVASNGCITGIPGSLTWSPATPVFLNQSLSLSLQSPCLNTGEPEISTHDLILYPNPASGHCTIDLSELDYTGAVVSLVDLMGNSLRVIQVGQESVELDLTSIPRGMYFIIVESVNRSYSVKLAVH